MIGGIVAHHQQRVHADWPYVRNIRDVTCKYKQTLVLFKFVRGSVVMFCGVEISR